MTELLVGTKKGLFALTGGPGEAFEVTDRAFAGEPVEFALHDPRSDRLLVSVTSPFYGPKVWYTGDGWEQAEGLELPARSEVALERIWVLALGEAEGVVYAGGDPGVLFESRDGGLTFTVNQGLYEHPSRPHWQPGAGGLCLHSIVPWPGDPDRIAVGVSAGGVWLTDDGGQSWRSGNAGIEPRYLPEDVPDEDIALCVHSLERAVTRPERMYMQFHGGVYRSDDAGESWTSIADGLPSDFGFPLAVDPADPESAFLIPLVADIDRVTPEGRVRVYETRDGGARWTPHGTGLPAQDAYLTILRQAFGSIGEGDALELYFGATSGAVYGSADAGATWFEVATNLPPVLSVTAVSQP